jgi:hypothetical protein
MYSIQTFLVSNSFTGNTKDKHTNDINGRKIYYDLIKVG